MLREILHRLLYLVLTKIRSIGEQIGNQHLFQLATLFQPVPLQLAAVPEGEHTYDHVLSLLHIRASQHGLAAWLDTYTAACRRWTEAEGRATTSRWLLYCLLYAVLVELRIEAEAAEHKEAYGLAYLFHNTPLELEMVVEGKGTYDEIYNRIVEWTRESAVVWECKDWLEEALREVDETGTT